MSSLRTQENAKERVVRGIVRTTPYDWPNENLGELCTLQLGKMLNKKARETFPQFPYLGNKDVQWGNFDFSDLREMHFDEREREKFRLIPGDLLVCEGGEIGRTALWTGEFDCYYQKAIHRLRVQSPARVDPRFILHFMRFAATRGLFRDLTSQSSIAHLTREKLARLKVPLPFLLEQRKIAAILSSVDDTIEQTQAVIDQVQVVKRGVMQELLTRGLPGRHTRFRQTAIGEIPESWRLIPLEQLIQDGPDNGLYRPQSAYGKGIPIVRIDAFDNGDRLQRPDLRRVTIGRTETERFAVKPGDILINRVNSLSHLAKCALVEALDEPTVYESNMMRLRLDDSRVVRGFGFRWLSSVQAKNHFKRRAKRAVAQASINQNDVLTIPTPCPPRLEQQCIADVAGEIERRIEAETATLAGLKEFKSALISVLLTGELRVVPDSDVG